MFDIKNKNNIFFAPVPFDLYSHLLEYNRLYSYPKKPEPSFGRSVVIDSGAFGLMEQGLFFNKNRINKLCQFHEDNCKDENFILVAPDIPKDPFKTIDNFLYYKSLNDLNINPCFHFKKGDFDLFQFKKQYDFYKKYCNFDIVFISDRKVRKSIISNFDKIKAEVAFMRQYLPKDCFIHYFSAGKSVAAITELCKLPKISFDTTSWQYDAKSTQESLTNYGVLNTGEYIKDCKSILNKINSITNGYFIG